MKKLRSKELALALIVFAFLTASLYAIHRIKHPRPHYIFINETDHHEHDLSLKISLKLAEKRSGIENALVILKNLSPNETIEQMAERIFQHYQIGRQRNGKGILYLYSEHENSFKIEVSYALEGIFPDAFCRQMEEAAKTYMLSDIPQDFLSELMITMNIRGQDNKEELDGSFEAPAWLKSPYLSGGAGASTKGYKHTLNEYMQAIQHLPTDKLGDYSPSPNPQVVVDNYLKSLQLGLGDPQLPFLTQGSQIFRIIVPRNQAQQQRVYNYYLKAMPFQIFTHEDLGLVVFRPGVENLPIVLRHSHDGLWFIDEPKSWTYFHRFEDGTDFFPNYDDIPFMQDLITAHHPNAQQPIYIKRVKTPPVIPYPFSLIDLINNLEKKIEINRHDDKLYAQLGEIYLFEIGWGKKALEMFEQASSIDPQNLEYRWRLFDLYINDSDADKALKELKFLAEALPDDQQVQQWYIFYSQTYNLKPGEFD